MKPELLSAASAERSSEEEMCVRYQGTRSQHPKYIHFHLQIFAVGH